MNSYKENKEWKIMNFNQDCVSVYYETNTNNYSSEECILTYNFNIQRFSSMYYSSVIIPALGMTNNLILYNFFFILRLIRYKI